MASDLRMYYQDLVGPEVKAAHLDIVRNNYHIVGKSVTPQDIRNYLKYFDEIVNNFPVTDEFFQSAVHRYEKIWIPFLKENSKGFEDDLNFIPPDDIRYVWYVHMLYPDKYKGELEYSVLGRTINYDYTVLEENIKNAELLEKTKEAWKMFTEEPYDYNININNNIDVNDDTDIKINNESTTMERYNNQNKEISNGVAVRSDYKFNIATVYKSDISEIRVMHSSGNLHFANKDSPPVSVGFTQHIWDSLTTLPYKNFSYANRVHPKPTLGTARKLKIEKSTGFEFDLVKAAKLHIDNKASFLLHESDSKLDECIFRYAMLLGLQRIYPGNKLVPDYDVDLVWSVHKLKPEIYQEDLKKMNITDLKFISSCNSSGNDLAYLTEETSDVWEETFLTSYSLPISFTSNQNSFKDVAKERQFHTLGSRRKSKFNNQKTKLGTTSNFKELTKSLPSLYPDLGNEIRKLNRVRDKSVDTSMSRFTSNSSITDHRRVISRNTTSPLYHSEARFTPVFQDVDGREWNVYSGHDETDDEHRDRRMRRSRSGSTRQYYRSQVSMAGLPSYRGLYGSRDDIIKVPLGQVLYRSHVIHLIPLDASSLNPELLCLSPQQLASFSKGIGYSMIMEITLKVPKKYDIEQTKITLSFKDMCNSEEKKVTLPGIEDLKETDVDVKDKKKILKYKALVPGYLYFPEDVCGFQIQAFLSIGSRVSSDIVQINHPSQSYNFINESRISNLKFYFSGAEKEMRMTILKGRKVLEKPVHKVFSIKRGLFECLCVHPKDLSKVLGPMNLDDLPDLNCEVPLWLATHTIIQEKTGRETGISIRVIHCLDLLLSVVQVIVDNRMVVVAHTVGTDYVRKYKKKLGKVGDNLDDIAWRAMVIKDCFGETGLVLGAWTHLVKSKRKTLDFGHCSYTYLNLRKNNEVQQFELKLHGMSKKLATTVDFGGTKLDFKKGQLSCGLTEKDLLHKLGLSFVSSVLYLLTQTKPLPVSKKQDNFTSYIEANDSSEMLLCSGWGSNESNKNIPSIINMLATLSQGSNLFESLALNRHYTGEELFVTHNRNDDTKYPDTTLSSSSSVKVIEEDAQGPTSYVRCYSVDDDIHEFDIKEPSAEKPLDASSNYFTDEDEKEKYIEKTIHSNLKASEKSSSPASSSSSEQLNEITLKEDEIIILDETEIQIDDQFVEVSNVDEVDTKDKTNSTPDDIVENKTEEASNEKRASKVDFQEEVMTTQLSVSEDNILNDVHENEDIKKHEVATKVPSSGQVSMWDECEIVI